MCFGKDLELFALCSTENALLQFYTSPLQEVPIHLFRQHRIILFSLLEAFDYNMYMIILILTWKHSMQCMPYKYSTYFDQRSPWPGECKSTPSSPDYSPLEWCLHESFIVTHPG